MRNSTSSEATNCPKLSFFIYDQVSAPSQEAQGKQALIGVEDSFLVQEGAEVLSAGGEVVFFGGLGTAREISWKACQLKGQERSGDFFQPGGHDILFIGNPLFIFERLREALCD